MMTIRYGYCQQICLILICLIYFIYGQSNINGDSSFNTFKLGGVLSDIKSQIHFNETLSEINEDVGDKGGLLQEVTILMSSVPIVTAIDVCNKLVSQGVYSILLSNLRDGDQTPISVSYISGLNHIPVIGIASRESAFSDKNIHSSFIRTVPPYSDQAAVWVELLKILQYTQVIIVHSADTDGRAILGRFTNSAQNHEDEKDITVELVIEFEPGVTTFVHHLNEMRKAFSRVILLYASKQDAQTIFHDASYLNMTTESFVWIVTEQALTAQHAPVGTIGLKLIHANNINAHITDSMQILAMALQKLKKDKSISRPPKTCNNAGDTWETGRQLFRHIRNQNLKNGLTGKVAFDDHGDRKNAEYDVINIQEMTNVTGPMTSEVKVGRFTYNKRINSMKLNVAERKIYWPGNTKTKPKGYMIPTKLRVLTIEEKPFVTTEKVKDDDECIKNNGVPCPWYNSSNNMMEVYCCTGYCIDLLVSLAVKINFTFELALSPDGQFGSYDLNKTSGRKEWTGLIGEMVQESGGADMIVAPLTIDPERAKVIEFTKPFKYQGITILEKKQPRYSTLVSFMQPFRKSLWILVLVSVHIVALALYLLDRFSPFGRYKLANVDGTEEDALNLSSATWFSWGVLLNSGIGEGTPRSFSARVLGMFWAGFAMIIVASYTANLAAFLVLDRPQTSLTGINDARLRNPKDNFMYATVKGSSVEMYFRRQVDLSNMYRYMKGFKSTDEAIREVKEGNLKAFIWDSSRLEYEAAKECELVTSGEIFGRSGYGIGLRKGSPWTDKVTLAILDFHESGQMQDLDNKWILKNPATSEGICATDEKAPATLGLKNMAGAFILVGAAIVGGMCLIIIEIIYKRRQIKKQKTLEIARHAFDKWRDYIEKRKTAGGTLPYKRRYRANGLNENTITSYSVDQNTVGAIGGGPSSSVVKVSNTFIKTGVGSIAAVASPFQKTLHPPPLTPSSLPQLKSSADVLPATTPTSRWNNDARKRNISTTDERLPPPPPPPQGVDRYGSSFKHAYGSNSSELIV